MLFPLLSLSLIALSPTFYESFTNANSATFINFINFRVYRNECIVTKILIKFFLLANNFGTGKHYSEMSHYKTHSIFKRELK